LRFAARWLYSDCLQLGCRPCRVGGPRAAEPSRVVDLHLDSKDVSAGTLPNCDAPDKFKVAGDDGPQKLDGELRRHVYRHSGRPVRLKIKLKRDGEIGFQNWYAVMHDGVSGWQAQKPVGYVAVPYVGSLDPFDSELVGDALVWPEGEKDVDTLSRLGIPAFTFGELLSANKQ
jgi:hypothetical protein